MRLPRRFKLWLLASLIAAPLGVGAIVLSATCVATHGSSAGAAPPALLPPTATITPVAARAVLAEASVPIAPAPAAQPGDVELFVWPADGNVSSAMTPRHPSGIDIASGVGGDVHAARGGTVSFAGGDPCCSYGNFIVIAHDDGWWTVYGHLSKFLVKQGDPVAQGQPIGLSGDTGYVTGPHLHFEIRRDGRVLNPLDYLHPARFVQADPPAMVAAADAPAPTATPILSSDLSAADAMVLGIAWMASNQEAAYTIEPSTCYAIEYGVNWLVTCQGQLDGCGRAGACQSYLSACVFEQPRGVITRYCPQ